MDKGRAISQFLERVDTFQQIVLITEEEVGRLFGEEVMTALARMERLACEHLLCSDCRGKCCEDIGCEVFAPQFRQCPIHTCRPIACRLHFCHKFDIPCKSTIIALRDIFVGCYQAVDIWNSRNIASLDSPPLSSHCPEFVEAIASLVASVREGNATPEAAAKLIMREALRYRQVKAGKATNTAAQ